MWYVQLSHCSPFRAKLGGSRYFVCGTFNCHTAPLSEPNLRLRMQIQLINFAGLDEAGIDGGGIFREFMTELIRTSFDPNRGFFRYTHDKLLYPNPDARLLFDNYLQHYFFLGRILGKVKLVLDNYLKCYCFGKSWKW